MDMLFISTTTGHTAPKLCQLKRVSRKLIPLLHLKFSALYTCAGPEKCHNHSVTSCPPIVRMARPCPLGIDFNPYNNILQQIFTEPSLLKCNAMSSAIAKLTRTLRVRAEDKWPLKLRKITADCAVVSCEWCI